LTLSVVCGLSFSFYLLLFNPLNWRPCNAMHLSCSSG
jgi:hypothetical protein